MHAMCSRLGYNKPCKERIAQLAEGFFLAEKGSKFNIPIYGAFQMNIGTKSSVFSYKMTCKQEANVIKNWVIYFSSFLQT
jgi:hypothetical protein